MLNLRSRQNRVMVGAVDITPALLSIEITDSQWDETSGLKKAAGTLKLSLATPGFVLDFDPRTNPTLWVKGQSITVDVENSAGNLVRHPRGALHLLRIPKVPTYGDTGMELSIGCALTLNDWLQPAGDKSGNGRGSSSDRGEMISAIAEGIGLPPLQTPILDQVAGPQPQLGGGYVAQMGILAAAVGHVLYIDRQGALRAQAVNPNRPPVAGQYRVGRDEQVWERGESQEAPIEAIKAHATIKDWKRISQDGPKRIYSVSTSREYNPSEIAETTFDGFGDGDNKTGSSQVIQSPKGIVFDLPSRDPSLITALIDHKYSYYDASNGFRKRDEQIVMEPLGKIFPAKYPQNTQPWPSKQIFTRYVYENLATKKIFEETYEPAGIVNPPKSGSLTLSLTPILSAIKTTEWQAYGEGWLEIVSSRDIKAGTTNTTANYSGSGNAQPPAPDRAPDEWAAEDKLIECEAKFPAVGGQYEREKPFEFSGVQTHDQLCALAQLTGQMLRAKMYPVSWAGDLRDSELDDWSPLQTYEWFDGKEYGIYLAVGQSWTTTQTQSVTAIDAYQTARRPAPTIGNPLPNPVPLWLESSANAGYLELYSSVQSFDLLPIEETISAGYLVVVGGAGGVGGGYFILIGAIISESGDLAFDAIVVDGGGNVVTSNGFVVTTTGDLAFDAIVVDGGGNVVTSNGFVVTTTGDLAFDAIVVDGGGNVVTSNGFVVTG
jgi:hypothetical protein